MLAILTTMLLKFRIIVFCGFICRPSEAALRLYSKISNSSGSLLTRCLDLFRQRWCLVVNLWAASSGTLQFFSCLSIALNSGPSILEFWKIMFAKRVPVGPRKLFYFARIFSWRALFLIRHPGDAPLGGLQATPMEMFPPLNPKWWERLWMSEAVNITFEHNFCSLRFSTKMINLLGLLV